MLTRRSALIGLAAVIATPAFADPSAKAFLDALYKNYIGANAKGVSIDGAANVRRYFTPALARLIDADARAAAKRNDAPVLNGDPFIDAQDWEIKSFAIDVKEAGPDKATGTVKFRNFDRDSTVVLDLVRQKDGWRIDEIRAPTTRSLRALMSKK